MINNYLIGDFMNKLFEPMVKDLRLIWKLKWARLYILSEFLPILNYFTTAIFMRTLIAHYPNETVGIDKVFEPLVAFVCSAFILTNTFKEKMSHHPGILKGIIVGSCIVGIVVDIILVMGYLHWGLYLLQLIADMMIFMMVQPISSYVEKKYIINITVPGDTMEIVKHWCMIISTILGIIGGIVALSIMSYFKDINSLLIFNAKFDIVANVLWAICFWISAKILFNLSKLKW